MEKTQSQVSKVFQRQDQNPLGKEKLFVLCYLCISRMCFVSNRGAILSRVAVRCCMLQEDEGMSFRLLTLSLAMTSENPSLEIKIMSRFLVQ